MIEYKSTDIDDRIIKLKMQLDKFSDSDDDELEDSICVEQIDDVEDKIITEDEEKSAIVWDLCEMLKKKSDKKCKHECGQFAIDEELDVFKHKVIRKANIVISCYKNKMVEYENIKHQLENSLQKYNHKKMVLEEKLSKYSKLSDYLERENKRLLDDRHIRELRSSSPKFCFGGGGSIRCSESSSYQYKVVCTLQTRLEKYECESIKLEYMLRETNEQIDALKRKVALLIQQNKKLSNENIDLKQLEKILTNLKCLCDKYNAFKIKCNSVLE